MRVGPSKRPFDPGSKGTGSVVPQGTPMDAGRSCASRTVSHRAKRNGGGRRARRQRRGGGCGMGRRLRISRPLPQQRREATEGQCIGLRGLVRRRQRQLAHDRLSLERVSRLRPDNPEMDLMRDLAGGMRVHLPEEFTPNGSLPRTLLRDNYVAAVNKILAALIEQKLAFLLPLEMGAEPRQEASSLQSSLDDQEGQAIGTPLGGFEQGRRDSHQHG